MKLAILINDPDYKSKLLKTLNTIGWTADFFQESTDFGQVKISEYDVIISDISLKPVDGRQILKSIRYKTKAELFLLGNGNGFSETDVYSDYIKGLINKNNMEDLVDKLNYVSIKKRIQSELKDVTF